MSLRDEISDPNGANDSSIVRGIILWPAIVAGHSLDTVLRMVSHELDVLHSVPIGPMEQERFRGLIVDIYRGQDFLGTEEDGYALSGDKTYGCWRAGERTNMLVVRVPSIDRLNELKEAIRSARKDLGKHAVHTTDTDEETAKFVQVAQAHSPAPILRPSVDVPGGRVLSISDALMQNQRRRVER